MSSSKAMLLIYLACATVLVVPGFGLDLIEAPAAQPRLIDLGFVPFDPNQGLQPEPQQGFYDYLDSCIAEIPVECGEEIFGVLLKGNIKGVTNNCCRGLLKMGEGCHEALVKSIASIDPHKPLAPEIEKTGKKIWRYCLLGGGAYPQN